MEPLAMRNARGFDGLGCVGGLGRKTRRLGNQSVWTRRRRLGRVGRCGRRAAHVNWRMQCKFESNTRRVQRPLLPGPPRVSSSMTGGRGCTRTLGLRAMGRRAFGAFWVTWASLGRQSGGLCARATRKTFAVDRLVPLPSLLTRKKSAHSTEDGPPSTSVLGCGRSWTTA